MTLIEKYGLVRSVQVIQDFYDDVVRDPLLADLFDKVSISDLAEHQADVLVMVMGGAHSHTHRQIEHIHRGFRISGDQFNAMIRHLENRLLTNGFDALDTDQIITSYRGYSAAVAGSTA
jgi:truncated hemoglobin YjbI